MSIRQKWCWIASLFLLVLTLAPRAEVTVEPASGSVLSNDLQFVTLNFDPAITDAELLLLPSQYELRDTQHGVLYATPMPVGFEEPYDQVLLIFQPDYPWTTGGQVNLEIIPTDLDPPGTITRLHAEWTFACEGCGWLADSTGYSLSVFGANDEILDALPTDLDRDGDLDLALIASERIIWLGLDPLYDGLVSQSLGVRNLDRPLSVREASNASYSGRTGQEILLYSTGQDEHLTIFRRSGSGDTLWFTPEQISGESFSESPLLMLPVGSSGDHLCNDLLVANRGGNLVLFPSLDDCSAIDLDAGQTLAEDLGTPLSMLQFPGCRYGSSSFLNIWAVLDDSNNQLHVYGWDGASLQELLHWSHSEYRYESLLAWSDFDLTGVDLVLYNSAGEFCLLSNLSSDTPQPQTWDLERSVYHARSGQRGELLFAVDDGVLVMPDPAQPTEYHQLISSEAMGGSHPKRLRLFDANFDGDQDLVVLMQDGSVHVVCEEHIGTRQLAYTDSLSLQHLLPGEVGSTTLYMRNEGAQAPVEVSIEAPPVDSPVQWDAVVAEELLPGEVFSLPVSYTAGAALDTIYTDLLVMDWTVPGTGRINRTPVILMVSGGETEALWSADLVEFEPECDTWAAGSCDPACPTATVTLSCPAEVEGRLEILSLEASSTNAAAEFCHTAEPLRLLPGQETQISLRFCPLDNSQRPLQIDGSLLVEYFHPEGTRQTELALRGVIQCEDPWFSGELPALLEDVPQVVDFSSLIGDDDDPPSTLILTIEDVVGTGEADPAEVLQHGDLNALRVELIPGENVNSELFPDLALALRLGDQAGNFTRDTLAVRIDAVDDSPVLQIAPGPEVVEGAVAQLGFQVFNPDASGLVCSVRVTANGDSLTGASFTGSTYAGTQIPWAVEAGDSLLFGSLDWQLDVQGSLPLQVSGSSQIRTAWSDLRLRLLNTVPNRLSFGDTLELQLAVDLEQGPWNGMLELAVSTNGERVAYRNLGQVLLSQGSLDLDPFYLVMPLSSGVIQWQAELLPSGGREDATGNAVSGTLDLRPFEYGVHPRIFTPNGDGINDVGSFDFGALAPRDAYRVELYDLGGQRLLRTTLPAGVASWSWDGRVDSHSVLPGVYPYVMLDGNQVLARGTVGVAR